MSELDALRLLRRIEEGVAGNTGEAFFRQIVCEGSRALHAQSAFTSWLLPELLEHVVSLARVRAANAIDSTLAKDSSANSNCTQLRALAARYDVRGIRQALERRSVATTRFKDLA